MADARTPWRRSGWRTAAHRGGNTSKALYSDVAEYMSAQENYEPLEVEEPFSEMDHEGFSNLQTEYGLIVRLATFFHHF